MRGGADITAALWKTDQVGSFTELFGFVSMGKIFDVNVEILNIWLIFIEINFYF